MRSEPILPARAAFVGAVFDLRARQAKLSLRDYLAATYRHAKPLDSVEVNGVISASDPVVVAEEAEALIARGITTIKIKVAACHIAVDVDRLAAARSAAPAATFRIDANGGWCSRTAEEALDLLAPFGVVLCEEPVQGVEEIAQLAGRVEIPLAVDESVYRLSDMRQLWRRVEEISTIVIKPQAIGGDDLAMIAIAQAHQAGLEVVVTTMLDTAVGVAHAAHVAAAGLSGAHGLDTGRLLKFDVAKGLRVEDGRIWFSNEPGLGIGAVSLD